MLQSAWRASKLASRTLKARSPQVKTCQLLPSTIVSAHKNFASIAGQDRFRHPPRYLPRRHSKIPSVRYCSYQRNMCRAYDDVASGSVNVNRGREVLPTSVKPVHYDLTLEPNFEKFTYEGRVVIEYVQPKV